MVIADYSWLSGIRVTPFHRGLRFLRHAEAKIRAAGELTVLCSIEDY